MIAVTGMQEAQAVTFMMGRLLHSLSCDNRSVQVLTLNIFLVEAGPAPSVAGPRRQQEEEQRVCVGPRPTAVGWCRGPRGQTSN